MVKTNFDNRTLYQGDNLKFLQALNSETIDLIATDQPFKKGKDFHATPDSLAAGASFSDRWSWKDDIHLHWLNNLDKDHPEVMEVIKVAKKAYGDDMGAFLCWLGVRMLECHRLLKPSGSLYLHIDHTAHAYAKVLLDAIFGQENFRNEIVWSYSGNSEPRYCFPRKHDTILFYGKSNKTGYTRISLPYAEGTIRRYNHVDDDGRRYKMSSLRNGLEKVYMKDGKAATDVWTDIPVIRSAQEQTGYPTQKPLALYERIIQASTNLDDVVLDPHAGCATTPIAAERLGRQWIAMDIWKGAYQMILDRLNAEKQLWRPEHIKLVHTPPPRTDQGETAAEHLLIPGKQQGQPRYPAPRSQHGRLLADIGPFCQGCGRCYEMDPHVLEVDHQWPKSQKGTDIYDNLTLLCPPCNREKSDKLTLKQLQEQNRKNGHLTPELEGNIKHGRRPPKRRRARK